MRWMDSVVRLIDEPTTRPPAPVNELERFAQRDGAVGGLADVEQACEVLHISSVHPYDDVRIVYRECAMLRRAGWNVYAAFFDVPVESIDGVPLIDMGRRPSSRVVRAVVATRRMRALVAAVRPRAVHLHDPELLPLALLLKRAGLVVFYDAHEDLPKQIFHKHWIPEGLRAPLSRLAARLLPRAFALVDGLIVASSHIHDASALDHHRVVLRNMPVRCSDGCSACAPTFEMRERAVAYIGAITAARGTEAAVRAALDTGCTVYLAGHAHTDCLERVRALDPERVKYLGVVAPPGVRRLLDRCRVGIAVLPATPAYLEAVPSKVFDYLKAGLPCVISKFRHWQEDLGPELVPYAVDPGDRAALTGLIRELLDDEDAWMRARVVVHAVACRYPSADEESTRMIQLYREALGEQ